MKVIDATVYEDSMDKAGVHMVEIKSLSKFQDSERLFVLYSDQNRL